MNYKEQIDEAFNALRTAPRAAVDQADELLREKIDLTETDKAWLYWIKGSGLAHLHQPKDAFEALKNAEALCRTLGERKLLRRTLRYLAAAAYEIGEYQAGAAAAEESLTISHQLNDTSSYVGVLYNELAGNFSRLGKLEAALNAFLSAFKIAESNGDKKLEAMVLANLATFYQELGLSTKSVDLLEKVAASAKLLNLPLVEVTANVNLGGVLIHALEWDRAERVLLAARDQAVALQATDLLAILESHLGDLYVDQDRMAVARAHFVYALDAFTRMGNQEGINATRQRLITLNSPAVLNDVAIHELQVLLADSEKGGTYAEQISILEQLVRLLELEQRFSDANQALHRLAELKSSVNRAALSANMGNIQQALAQSQLATKLHKSELAQFMQAANVARQRQTIWILVGGLLFAFASVGALAILLRKNQATLGRLRAAQKELELQRERQQALDRRLSEQVRAESLSVLTAGVAHDFNNLLTGILGLAELAILDPLESAKDNYLSQISAASIQAAELTRQLSLCMGQPTTEPSVCEVTGVVEAAKGLLAGVARPKAPLEIRGGEQDLWIGVCEANLRQVLVNLVANAADATENHEFIDVLVGRRTLNRFQLDDLICGAGAIPGEFCYLSVVDRGSGISPETQARIFDPYFTTKTRGRGLGLASVQGIVKAGRGAMEVQSALGNGTAITVYFPAASPQQINVALNQTMARCDRIRSDSLQDDPIVMVVDDDNTIRESFATILRCYHFRVQKAATVDEAIGLFHELGSDLACVITDYSMPLGTGTSLAARLKKLNPDLPILVCSGFALENVFEDPNVTLFLQKPFTPTVLVEAIQKCLAKPKNATGPALGRENPANSG